MLEIPLFSNMSVRPHSNFKKPSNRDTKGARARPSLRENGVCVCLDSQRAAVLVRTALR